jgi:predicted AlkP superfamily phosphohydrolase/phosphomutase
VALALFSSACDRRGDDGRSGAVAHVDYASLREFSQSDDARHAPVTPVVFVGIDGAAWEFIEPLLASGDLPNLRRVREEGAYGRLRSIPCFVSPPAWATMMTGYLPEKTGVYTYGKWDAAAREFTNVNRDDVLVPQVWDVASFCGRRVGVFNVPMTYPPRDVNGAVVAGEMTPTELGDPPRSRALSREERERLPRESGPESFSPVQRSATDDSLNSYLWSLYDTVDDGAREYDTVTLDVLSRLDAAGNTRRAHHTFAAGRFSQWIRIRVVRDGRGVDAWCRFAIVRTPEGGYDTRISPTLAPIDARYTSPDTLAARLEEEFGFYVPSVFMGEELVPALAADAVTHASYFYDMDDWDLFLYAFTQSDNMHHLSGFSPGAVEVYRTIDRFIGDLMERMPQDAVLVVASDHGFREYEYGVSINDRLAQLGLLQWSGTKRVDYDSSVVFHNLWHLYFNHALVTPDELVARGIRVGPGESPAGALARYLEDALARVSSADGVWNTSIELDRYPGDAAGEVPDMRVRGASDDYVVDFLGFENPHEAAVRRLEGSSRWWHQRDGVVMLWGNGIRRGADLGTRDIQDVAPTMLYLLGSPVALDQDGRCIDDAFTRDAKAARRRFAVPDYSGLPRAAAATDSARGSLEKKLRSLGYIQ